MELPVHEVHFAPKTVQAVLIDLDTLSPDDEKIYPDAVDQTRKWSDKGLPLYSLNSSPAVNKAHIFAQWKFKARFAPKDKGPPSFETAAKLMEMPVHHILFVTASEALRNAAHQAGYRTILLQREGVIPSYSDDIVRDYSHIHLIKG